MINRRIKEDTTEAPRQWRHFTLEESDSDKNAAGAGAFAEPGVPSMGFSIPSLNPAPLPPAMGFSFAVPANAATTTAKTFVFGAAPAASTAQFTGSAFGDPSASTPSVSGEEVERLENPRKEDLFNIHKDIVSTTDVHEKERLIYKAMRNIGKFKKDIYDATKNTSSVASETTAAPSSGTSATAPMAAHTIATSSSATSSCRFSFGAAAAPAATSTTAPSSSAGFSFGAASDPAASFTTPFSSGGFSFGAAAVPAASSSAQTSPVDNTTAPAKDPAPNHGEPSNENSTAHAVALIQQIADPDWDDIGSFEPVTIYRNENGTWTPLQQKTKLRLQTSKTDSGCHRMVAQNMMGIVAINMRIQSGM
ncbi:hypothetical protein FisN_5Lu020 [Fistulifera solaris]|uniref:RanBD1 domain-containing protein n=1 Tax=Fistulifera solaris TaxID=1519565 RepID=A0A1Z5JJ63_FISSO|nr:hypothetical protein FisN_5Lu020 [Fistulifera solaris]|eukprot:GAX14060.1 hypothetical protein FisN_5Lu020 [Fistulifera solaris]